MKIIKIGIKEKIDIILRGICDKWGVNTISLKGLGRSKTVSRARTEAIALIRKNTPLSLTEIGKVFHRDHTTVIYACKVYINHPEYFNIY